VKKLGKPLSNAQTRMLGSVRLYGDPWARVFGGAAHGGAISTLKVLLDAKLIEDESNPRRPLYKLTPAGKKAEKTGRLPAPPDKAA